MDNKKVVELITAVIFRTVDNEVPSYNGCNLDSIRVWAETETDCNDYSYLGTKGGPKKLIKELFNAIDFLEK